MKTKIVWMLFAACMLGACSSDDEQQVEISQLEGRWLEVYEPGVVSEGIVYYTFHATSPTTGTCLIDVHDILSGDYQNEMNYQLLDDGKRIRLWGGFCATNAQEYEIVKFTGHRMEWKINDRKLYFERR